MVFQLGSPLLDTCVLAVRQKGDAYGYYLTQQVKKVVDISESTLYPVLRRLQKELCLETYDKEYQGRNRRYYSLTGEGRERCLYYVREWNVFKDAIDGLIEGSGEEEPEESIGEERESSKKEESKEGAQEGQEFSGSEESEKSGKEEEEISKKEESKVGLS